MDVWHVWTFIHSDTLQCSECFLYCRSLVSTASPCLCGAWIHWDVSFVSKICTHAQRFLLLLFLRAAFCPRQPFIFSLDNHLAILFVTSAFAVIQDVDNASLEGQYQSFASLMEQRLAELFVLASQQGTRFRRATTVGSFTVQVRNRSELTVRRARGWKQLIV